MGEAASIESAAKSIRWHRLLHFNAERGSSDVNNSKFFYAADGSTNPENELRASIDHMLNDSESIDEGERFACRFPARRRFIESKFRLKTKTECPQYQSWREQSEPDKINFVHAAQYVGNPASAFGHSFLRFDRQLRAGLLGFSFTYSAVIDPKDSGFAYAFKGLFGGYQGVYEFGDYYPKVHGYGSLENRELWEYQLKLTTEQRLWVFDHAWELTVAGQTKYYFLDRNCTYQLLALVDVADEGFSLAKAADKFYMTPPESVKILDAAGLIQKSDFRPSLRQKALGRYLKLNTDQQATVREVLRGEKVPEMITDAETSSALVATLAMNEVETLSPETMGLFSRASNARARLPASINSEIRSVNFQSQLDPLKTHGTAQVRAAVVSQDEVSAVQFGVRPALHSLNDSPEGFLPNSQLIFLDTLLQIDQNQNVQVREFTLIDIKSLQASSFVQSGVSWGLSFAFKPVLASGCDVCRQFRSAIQIGYSTELGSNNLIYALGGIAIDTIKPEDKLAARVGPTLNAGVLNPIGQSFLTQASTRLEYFVTGPFSKESLLNSEFAFTWLAARNSNWSVKANQVQNLEHPTRTFTEFNLQFAQSF